MVTSSGWLVFFQILGLQPLAGYFLVNGALGGWRLIQIGDCWVARMHELAMNERRDGLLWIDVTSSKNQSLQIEMIA